MDTARHEAERPKTGRHRKWERRRERERERERERTRLSDHAR